MKEYPIRVVSKITGLTSDQIRKWEERYPILKISRSDRGSRRFNDRDLEVLQLMVEAKKIGFTLQEIASELNVSVSTVKRYNSRGLILLRDYLRALYDVVY